MNQQKMESLSKFFTKILRHVPSEYGLIMNDKHFCRLDKFYEVVQEHVSFPVSKSEISYVLLNSKWNDAHRFDVWKGHVRATYRHTYNN